MSRHSRIGDSFVFWTDFCFVSLSVCLCVCLSVSVPVSVSVSVCSAGSQSFQNAGALPTRSCVFDFFTFSSTPHTNVRVRFIVFLQLLTVLVCAHSLQINGTTLIQSGPRGGMTPGDLPRAGFQHSVMLSLSIGQQQHNSPGLSRLRRL